MWEEFIIHQNPLNLKECQEKKSPKKQRKHQRQSLMEIVSSHFVDLFCRRLKFTFFGKNLATGREPLYTVLLKGKLILRLSFMTHADFKPASDF